MERSEGKWSTLEQSAVQRRGRSKTVKGARNSGHGTEHAVNGIYHNLGKVRKIWVLCGANQE
eukprot:275491-Pelagomonas_calceolata.AAC.4